MVLAKKLLIYLLLFSVVFQTGPFYAKLQTAKAEGTTPGKEQEYEFGGNDGEGVGQQSEGSTTPGAATPDAFGVDPVDLGDPNPENLPEYKPDEQAPAFMQNIVTLDTMTQDPISQEDSTVKIKFEDIFSQVGGDYKQVGPKIILKKKDYDAIKALYCLSDMVPEYAKDLDLLLTDMQKLKNDEWPEELREGRPETAEALADLRDNVSLTQRNKFRAIVKAVVKNWGTDVKTKLIEKLTDKNDPDRAKTIRILVCVTGETNNAVTDALNSASDSQKIAEFKETINFAYDSLKIDIRIIKALVYLVTPKAQGGAGHYRLRVHRISQPREMSTESDAVLGSNNQQIDTAGKTAAQIGQDYYAANGPDATTEDGQGNTTNDAYLSYMTDQQSSEVGANEDAASPDQQANYSAHFTGQAMDISEVDDIRCTLVGHKKIGRDKRTPQPATPVKLAWQSNEGYEASGGNKAYEFDLAGRMRGEIAGAIRDLSEEFGADLSDYQGDISKASVEDLVTMVGKSLFGQVINTGQGISGYDVQSTLEKLGGLYFADYFGLPREAFNGRTIDSIQDIYLIIGQAAIEKRAGLPIGTLSEGTNLKSTLESVGRRKIEYEMGLDAKDLVGMGTTSDIATLVGRRVIEKELSIKQDAFAGRDFQELSKNIGPLKTKILKSDPVYVDKLLHIKVGSTADLIANHITPNQYTELVGTVRVRDTAYGFDYLQSHDSAYNLPDNTWRRAMSGEKSALRTIGIHLIAKAFVADKTEAQKQAFIKWLSDGIGQREDMPDFSNDYTALSDYLWRSIKSDKEVIPAPDELSHIKATQLRRFQRYVRRAEDAYEREALADQFEIPLSFYSDYKLIFSNTVTEDLNFDGAIEGKTPSEVKQMVKKARDNADDFAVFMRTLLDDSMTDDPENNPSKVASGDYYNYVIEQAEITYRAENQCIIPDQIVVKNVHYQTIKQNNTLETHDEPEVVLKEDGALTLGLNRGDMFRVFGCPNSSGRGVFERIGSKLLYYALINDALTDKEKHRIDLEDTNPEIRTDNREILFYLERVERLKILLEGIRKDYQELRNDPLVREVTNIDDTIRQIDSTITGVDLFLKIDSIKRTAKQLSAQADRLKVLADRKNRTRLNQKYNALVLKIEELNRTISEIIEGRPIPAASDLRQDQIHMRPANSDRNGANAGNNKKRAKITPLTMIGLISGKLKAKDAFRVIAAQMLEESLDLPHNTLIYFMENKESKGFGTKDSFYQAIGQAKVEEQLSMPDYYFQGYVDRSNVNFAEVKVQRNFYVPASDPNWGEYGLTVKEDLGGEDAFKANQQLFEKFKKYLKIGETNVNYTDQGLFTIIGNGQYYKLPDSQGQLPGPQWKAWYDAWQDLVKVAKDAYLKEQAQTNINAEKDMKDVSNNVKELQDIGKIEDIRSPDGDVLFRFGFTTNATLQAIEDGSPTFWTQNGTRAQTIDRNLKLPLGTTQSLFTKRPIKLRNGLDLLSAVEKESIAAGFPMPDGTDSKIALDNEVLSRYLQVLNGDIDLEGFKVRKAQNSYFNKFNRFGDQSGQMGAGGECKVIYQPDTKGFKIAESSIQNNAFIVIGTDGKPRSFPTLEDANRYINTQPDMVQDYSWWMAMYLYKLAEYINAKVYPFSDAEKTNFENFSAPNFTKINEVLLQYLRNPNFELLPLDNIESKIRDEAVGSESEEPETLIPGTNITIFTLRQLFGNKTTLEKTLPTYKRNVGITEARRVLVSTIWRNLGIDIDPSLFDADDLFDILNGDYRSLRNIASTLIDQRLDLPPNTVRAIMSIRSFDDIKCTLYESGARIMGSWLGLNRVELSGNLWHNIGQARVEETLGLPQGSFKGSSFQYLVGAVMPIEIALAFRYPLGGQIVGQDGTILDNTIDSAALMALRLIYKDDRYVNSIKDKATRWKLERVLEALQTNTNLDQDANDAIHELELTITARHLEIVNMVDRRPRFLDDQKVKGEVTDFINRLNYLDTYFELDSFIFSTTGFDSNAYSSLTFKLITERFSPDAYAERVTQKLMTRLTLEEIAERTGLIDDEHDRQEAQIIYDTFTHLDNYYNCHEAYVVDEYGNPISGCDTYYHNWGKLYDDMDKVFSMQLDKKAGLIAGSFSRILHDPSSAPEVLLENAARRIDMQLKLDSNSPTSATKIYKQYETNRAAANQRREFCSKEENYIKYLKTGGTSLTDSTVVEPNELLAYQQANGQYVSSSQLLSDALGNPVLDTTLDPLSSEYDEAFANWQGYIHSLSNSASQAEMSSSQLKDLAISRCMAGTLKDGADGFNQSTFDNIKLTIAQTIKDYVRNQTGLDIPLEAVKMMIFRGDLRYFEVTIMAFGANRYVNYDTDEDEMVPASMRITFADIQFGTLGDPQVEEDLAVASQYSSIMGYDPPDESARPYGVYAPPGARNIATGVAQITSSDPNTAGPPRDEATLRTNFVRVGNYDYGITDGTTPEQQRAIVRGERDRLGAIVDPKQCPDIQSRVNMDFGPQTDQERACERLADLDAKASEGKRKAQKAMRDSLTFSMIDVMLYRLDHNAYRGFAWDLYNGSWTTRLMAIGTYVYNGLRNCNLGGVKLCENGKNKFLSQMPSPQEMVHWASFIDTIANIGMESKVQAFLASDSYKFVDSYITRRSKAWFGFSLPPNSLGSLIVGFHTGHWLNPDTATHAEFTLAPIESVTGQILDQTGTYYTYKFNGKDVKIPTLSTLVISAVEYALEKSAFKWADRQLKLPPGTSYQLASKVAKLVGAIRAWNRAQRAFDAAQSTLNAALQAGDAAKIAEAGQATMKADTAKYAAKDAMKGAEADLISFVIITLINYFFSDEMATFDRAMGWVQGTTAALVGMLVTVGVALLLSGPIGWVGLALEFIFIIGLNVFGEYKQDIYCTADGFYPEGSEFEYKFTLGNVLRSVATGGFLISVAFTEMGVNKSNSAKDANNIKTSPHSTGLGIWNGQNQKEMTDNSIKAAKYRAREIVGDMLSAQDNPLFADVIPNQIMTGKQCDGTGGAPCKEPPIYWIRSVDEKICKRMGENYFANSQGICSTGDIEDPNQTHAGVWTNQQVGAWVHIGF